MFRLPSLQYLGGEILRVLLRFTLPVIITLIGTWAALGMVDAHSGDATEFCAKTIMTCLIGLPFLLSIALFTEFWEKNNVLASNEDKDDVGDSVGANAQEMASGMPDTADTTAVSSTSPSTSAKLSPIYRWGLQAVGVALLIAYFFTLPLGEDDANEKVIFSRFFLLALSAHFLVSFVPYIGRGSVHGFWQYNQTLFTRFLTAVLYSIVLYAGLSIAILAIDQLFEVRIDSDNYIRLFVFIAGIFNTFFFLAGVPKNFYELEENNTYPFGLKVFTQYVLIPLVTIYLTILYAYTVKILVQWQLPMGWVSYLILCFSVIGILALLLVYPIRNQTENTWIRGYRRFFFLALIPLIILLYVAIMRRIIDYGFTENRYFVFILAGWLAGITIYFNISKTRNIKVLPISLCLVCLLSTFGPWGAFSVSRYSQQKRLESMLQKNDMLDANGKAKPMTKALPDSLQHEIKETLRYLSQEHETASLQPYFSVNLDTLKKSVSYGLSDTLAALLNLKHEPIYVNPLEATNAMIEINSQENQLVIPITGYDIIFSEFDASSSQENEHYHFVHNNKKYNLSFNKEKSLLELTSEKQIICSMGMDTVAQRLHRIYAKENMPLPSKTMSSYIETPAANMKINIRYATVEKTDSTTKMIHFHGGILLKIK